MQLPLTLANLITIGRIMMIPLFVMAVMQVREGETFFRAAAFGIFVVMVIGDGADGFVARRFHRRTVLGAFLDPLGDKLMMFSAYVFLAAMAWPEPRMPRWVSTVVISRDLLIAIGFLTLFVVTGQFRMISPSGVGKLCTVVQALTILLVLTAPWVMEGLGERTERGILTGLCLLTVFLTLFSGVDYLYAARRLLEKEHVALAVEDRPSEE